MPMNPWLDRLAEALSSESPPHLSRDEAVLILDLAGAASRSAGARQFAPLATYMAGRAAAGAAEEERLAVLRAACAAAAQGGPAEPLGIE
jgi:hypothetical protein